jgi:penicillin-binding protein 1C
MADENKKQDDELNQPQDNENTVPHQQLDDAELTVSATQHDGELTVGATQHDAEMTQIDDYDAEQTMPNAIYSQEMPAQQKDSANLETLIDPASVPPYANENTQAGDDTGQHTIVDESDDEEKPKADNETLTTDMVEVDVDADVPFHLPHVSELDNYGAPDERSDSNKMITMPVYGDMTPKGGDQPTLPGTFGLDPSPEELEQREPRSAPAQQTMMNPKVHAQQSNPPPPPASQQTMANPQFQNRSPQQPPPPPGQQQQQQQRNVPPRLPRKRTRRKILGLPSGCIWVIAGLVVTFCGGLTLLSLLAAMIFVPQIEEEWTARIAEVDNYRGFESTFIYDRYGNDLYEAFGEGRRTRVSYDRIPRSLILATTAIEDDSFFDNIGIDVAATFVAFMNYVGAEANEETAGGSTITQQLVRNVLFDYEKRTERSVARKLEEIVLAIVLTQAKNKEEVLEMYLNEIYYGNLAYGVQTASQTFFGKDVENLTLGESALLAGLPQAPATLDPLNPDPAIQAAVDTRWRQVLGEMIEEGYITQDQANQALSEGLSFVSPDVPLNAPHFTVYAQGELERLMADLGYSPEEITRGGLRVYTTLDQNVNNLAQQSAANQVSRLAANNVSNASVVAIKPLTGEIVAMVGSIDYNNDAIDGSVNVATAFRQPGSTMKPFTYSAAIERGMTAGDVIWDTRTEIGIPGQPLYTPRNYDGAFHGPVAMRKALASSFNIPAVQTLRLVGVDSLLQLMRRFGVTTLNEDAAQYGLSLTLGGGEVSLIELTNAYGVFANQGAYVPVTSILCIVNSDNEIVYQYENSCPEGRPTDSTVNRTGFGKQVLDSRISFLMTDILGDNNARSAVMGANSPLRTDGIFSSVKTGTTNDVKDNWTVGYTRNLAVGVWVGNNDGQPMVNSSGLTGAAPIWNSVVTGIYNNQTLLGAFATNGQLLNDQPLPPNGMTLKQICDFSRLRDPALNCPATINEWFLDGPAGIPDADGNLNYPPQTIEETQVPTQGSVVEQMSPGVYRTLAFPLPPDVANGIQFNLGAGDKQPLPPKYCRVPTQDAQVASAAGAQNLWFTGGPATSQADAVEAERYAREHGLAFLPTIDCWADVYNVQPIGGVGAVLQIQQPLNGQIVNGVIPIIGTAQFDGSQADLYHFFIKGGQFADWTPLGQGHNSPVANGQLENLHADALPSGSYSLRLGLVRGSDVVQATDIIFTVP